LISKQDASDLYGQSIILWKSIKKHFSGDVFEYVLTGLEGRKNDAVLQRVQMDMYFDWKLGRLTEARIDELVESCRKIKGTRWIADPMDPNPDTMSLIPFPGGSSLAAFADDLKTELREQRLERYFRSLPKLDDAWGYGMTDFVDFEYYYSNTNDYFSNPL
jgi:hypothetical protein